jgi:hypothetical protein
MSLKSTKKLEAEIKKAPAGKVRVGLISASIWDNETEKGVFYNVTFERRYRDAAGQWHSTHSYGASDLLELMKCADLAHTQIVQAQNAPADEAPAAT